MAEACAIPDFRYEKSELVRQAVRQELRSHRFNETDRARIQDIHNIWRTPENVLAASNVIKNFVEKCSTVDRNPSDNASCSLYDLLKTICSPKKDQFFSANIDGNDYYQLKPTRFTYLMKSTDHFHCCRPGCDFMTGDSTISLCRSCGYRIVLPLYLSNISDRVGSVIRTVENATNIIVVGTMPKPYNNLEMHFRNDANVLNFQFRHKSPLYSEAYENRINVIGNFNQLGYDVLKLIDNEPNALCPINKNTLQLR